jgi:hypothetical protein
MLSGGSELAGKPAVVQAPLGKGNVLFFANNPFWRMETSGSYMLLFNAAINHKHLSSKKAQAAPTGAGTAGSLELGGMLQVHLFLEEHVRVDLLFPS